VLVVSGVALLAATTGAGAAPLDPVACLTLENEQRMLEAQGVLIDMAKGVEWARANLSAERIARVREFIDVKEKVLFRCPSLVKLADPSLAEPQDQEPPPAEATGGTAKPKAVAKAGKASGKQPPPPVLRSTAE
jgi:hypothetical protein